jgi:hypothetical protein
MLKSVVTVCLGAGLLSAGVSPAFADPVIVPFNVFVGSTHGDMVPIFGVSVHVGDVIPGTLTYDDAAVGAIDEPGVEIFHPAGSIALSLGSGLSLPIEIMQVFDDQPGGSPFDLDTVNAAASTTSFPEFDSLFMVAGFQGPPDARTTTALPRSLAEFASFTTTASFRFEGAQTGVAPPFDALSHEILGRVELANVPTPTPEPATGLLVLGGAGALLRKRRRS